MATCSDNKRLGRIGCGAQYSGESQHSVAKVSWSTHPDGMAHITGSLAAIESLWAAGRKLGLDEPVAPWAMDPPMEQAANGRWRVPMPPEVLAKMIASRDASLANDDEVDA